MAVIRLVWRRWKEPPILERAFDPEADEEPEDLSGVMRVGQQTEGAGDEWHLFDNS